MDPEPSFPIGDLPDETEDEPGDSFDLLVVELLGRVRRTVVIGVEAREEEDRRHACPDESPLIAPRADAFLVVLERESDMLVDASDPRIELEAQRLRCDDVQRV